MTTKYFAVLTNQGAALLANAAALGTKVNITSMAVGDGGGALPTPDPAQTKLTGELRRAALNSLSVDAANSSQIIAEQVIPEGEGGFWIREIGLYDADGILIAVANCPETYKPKLDEGSGRTQTVRMILIVNSTTAVTLKIDPSVVLATRKYVDDGAIVAKQYADTLLTQAKKYSEDQMAAHVQDDNPHSQYLLIARALGDIKDAGKVLEALKSLGIGEGAPLIGVPFPWPHAQMPNELFDSMSDMVFLKSNGASFSGILYPKLALAYPGLKLADLRGEFIRGWDDGRGVDAGRALLSAQAHAIQNIQASFTTRPGVASGTQSAASTTVAATGALSIRPLSSSTPFVPVQTSGSTGYGADVVTFDASTVVNTAAETRARNIAFNFLVRAQ